MFGMFFTVPLIFSDTGAAGIIFLAKRKVLFTYITCFSSRCSEIGDKMRLAEFCLLHYPSKALWVWKLHLLY